MNICLNSWTEQSGCYSMNVRLVLIIFCCLAVVDSWSQSKPKKPYQLYEEAEAQYNYRNFTEALSLLNEWLKLTAGYMEAYPLRSGAREQLKDLDGALTGYSIFLENFPE